MIAMFFKRLNMFVPIQQLLKLLLAMVIGIQVIIIFYNHLSGFNPIISPSHFFFSVIIGSALSFIAGLLITVPDLLIIRMLNSAFPWRNRVIIRTFIQLCLTVLLAFFVSILITLLSNWFNAYQEGLAAALVTNALIVAVLNIIMMMILEAWLFFMESNRAKLKAEKFEKELLRIQFEVLKSQINPHFMFNCLNVLSALIEKDVVKAQHFIDEFSNIYRYVLETIEKRVVSLNEELGFVRSYIFLQQIRYGDALTLTVNLPANLLHKLMPPLSLQVVLENAIKHNIVNKSQPLQIDIYFENHWLIVRNNIQLKISSNDSTGLGQNNMIKSYAMIGDRIPEFIFETNHYIVKLPLIDCDNDESINH